MKKENNESVNLTLAIPIDLKRKMQEHEGVNWSAIIRRLLQQHLERVEIVERIAQKSKLTQKDADEISEMIKRGVAKRHGLIKE